MLWVVLMANEWFAPVCWVSQCKFEVEMVNDNVPTSPLLAIQSPLLINVGERMFPMVTPNHPGLWRFLLEHAKPHVHMFPPLVHLLSSKSITEHASPPHCSVSLPLKKTPIPCRSGFKGGCSCWKLARTNLVKVTNQSPPNAPWQWIQFPHKWFLGRLAPPSFHCEDNDPSSLLCLYVVDGSKGGRLMGPMNAILKLYFKFYVVHCTHLWIAAVGLGHPY